MKKNWLNGVRKVAVTHVFEENGISRYIPAKELSAETAAIDDKLSKKFVS